MPNWFDRLSENRGSTTGSRRPVLVVGEVAQAHDGSLGMAHAYIDAIAAAGADAVKFQTHIAEAESTPQDEWRVRFSRQDASRLDYWRRMEFTEDQWRGLRDHATERGLVFLSSPFSADAVDLLDRLDVPAWKVASGEVSNPLLLDRLLRTGRPIVLSSGMSRYDEIDAAVAAIKSRRVPFAVLQCTTVYPCGPQDIGLGIMSELARRYDCPVGLSDHSGTIFPSLAAAVLGAEIVEVHVTFSREMFGPDVSASVTTAELRQLVEGVRYTEVMLAHPGDKDRAADALAPMRRLFTKSVVPRTNLSAGTVLRAGDLTVKKPGTGIPAVSLSSLVGRRIRRDVAKDELLQDRDLE